MNRLWLMTNGERLKAKDRKLWSFVFCLLSFVFMLSSCSSKKDISNLRTLSANHIIKEVERNNFEFNNLETKFNVKVKGDNNIGLKGQMRMQNDSVIWISISMKLGVEVARVMITNDSIMFVNRTNKTYLAESIDNFQDKLPMVAGLHFIQDILVGNNIQLRHNNKFKVTIDNENYKLTSGDESALRSNIWITPNVFKIKKYELSCRQSAIGNQQLVRINYDKFQEVKGKLLPTRIILDANEEFGLILEIDYSEIKVGENLEFPFNISKKYNKIKP